LFNPRMVGWRVRFTCCLYRFRWRVFWLDSQLRVVDKVLAQPWRPAYFPRQPARYVLELHPAYFLLLNAGESIVLHDA
jgi:uncharacterized membrane protein (UPF0127 family)